MQCTTDVYVSSTTSVFGGTVTAATSEYGNGRFHQQQGQGDDPADKNDSRVRAGG